MPSHGTPILSTSSSSGACCGRVWWEGVKLVNVSSVESGWVVLSLSTACCQLLVLPSEFCTPRMGLTDFSHRTKSWIIPCKACCRQEQMHSFCKNSWLKMSAETTALFLTGEANESQLRYWPYLSAAHSSSKGQWAAEEEPGAAS